MVDLIYGNVCFSVKFTIVNFGNQNRNPVKIIQLLNQPRWITRVTLYYSSIYLFKMKQVKYEVKDCAISSQVISVKVSRYQFVKFVMLA